MKSITDSLKSSFKGRLKYNKNGDLSELMVHLSPPPLSRCHEESPLSKSQTSFNSFDEETTTCDRSFSSDYDSNIHLDNSRQLSDYAFDNKSLSLSCDETEKADLSKEDLRQLSLAKHLNTSQNASSMSPENFFLSTKWNEANAAVDQYRQLKEEGVQLRLSQRKIFMDKHEDFLKAELQKQETELSKRNKDRQSKRQQNLIRKVQELQEEGRQQFQKFKEHQEKFKNKLKEIAKGKEELAIEEQKRQQHLQLNSILKTLDSDRKTFVALRDNYGHKDLLPDAVNKDKDLLDRLCSDVIEKMRTVQSAHSVPTEDIDKLQDHITKSQTILQQLKMHIDGTDAKVKAEEEKKKEEQKKAAALKKQEEDKKQKEAASDFKVQAFKYTLEEKSAKAKKLSEVEASIKPFIDNPQMKQYRFDLQRAVNTTINAISGISGAHLMDKLKKLHMLLSGQNLEVSGKYISIKNAPEALLFCQNLVAKMLVKKGEEQVTSKHESAFAIAAVVVGLWVNFPIIGELFLAHLYVLCPYVLPYYATRQDGQSNTDYFKSAGYKINEDGSVEEQDKFLRRMSGLMRLYTACMIVNPPNLAGNKHPHGVEHAWMWLARTMNLEPHPDITAAAIYDMLAVTGHYLFKQYKVQFIKLLYVLCKSYFPSLKNISVTSATVGRLEVFLEKSLQTASIPVPEGMLAHDFWSTS
ncbi:nucleoporin GLE1 [Biomphalaria glabrata]|nr:nucleoporin GLE1 [Biomphalaria glabrata]